jgi:hypothetical protein
MLKLRAAEPAEKEQQLVDGISLFYSYSHKDESLRDQLQFHLSLLKREGEVKEWHDRGIGAGTEWKGQIDEHLESSHLILLLISADFLASDYFDCVKVGIGRKSFCW